MKLVCEDSYTQLRYAPSVKITWYADAGSLGALNIQASITYGLSYELMSLKL